MNISNRRHLEKEVEFLLNIATTMEEANDRHAYLTTLRGIGATIRAWWHRNK